MSKTIFLLAACLTLSCARNPPEGVFRVADDPAYAHVTASLTRLVQERGTQPVDHFCVVGYKERDAEPIVWVHWVEENRLLLWEPFSADAGPEQASDLVRSRRNLDL